MTTPKTILESRIHIPLIDLRAALRHDLRHATDEGFVTVAARAKAVLQQIDEALEGHGTFVSASIVIASAQDGKA